MPLNMDTLREALLKVPKILHLSSHAEQDFLQIEEVTVNGKEDRVTKERLRTLLEEIQDKTMLVVISACKSGKIGQIFHEAGFPFVISYDEDSLLNDKLS